MTTAALAIVAALASSPIEAPPAAPIPPDPPLVRMIVRAPDDGITKPIPPPLPRPRPERRP